MKDDARTERTALLIGADGIRKLQDSFVAVAGLGGVGGHCTEALARAGIGKIHLIDADVVQQSNLNRQLIATKETVGMLKTAAMEQRLRLVSDCEVTRTEVFVTPETVETAFPGPDPDFIVDAIDSVQGKLAIAVYAFRRGIPVISCLGAGNRLDATAFYITDIFRTAGDPLARKFRSELRKAGIGALPVVISREPAKREPGQTVIGSIAPVPAAEGLAAASYVIRKLLD
ncbi:MAG: tRNA threonylcarbamoyladenosine dehydratase [Clostridia bacterium]|nr:tRNA threonylcarbamoyladenosine dehydratase [Clostridia bacterium]MBR0444850.1 tRNA threonylcarbamoyladenosine dehydratase [Clostridia bacterium]